MAAVGGRWIDLREAAGLASPVILEACHEQPDQGQGYGDAKEQ